MKINDMIQEKMNNPEFAREFVEAKERSASAIALYHARKKLVLLKLISPNAQAFLRPPLLE
jgi:hypothetical protein